jgi:hypothetical protein
MADYRYSGVHVLNDYITMKLITDGLISAEEYQGIVPFFPNQQTAFTNALPGPFFIYTYQKAGRETDFGKKLEQAVYTLYDADSRRIRDIVNYVSELLERLDIVAQEVTDYAASRSEYPNHFEFKYIRLLSGNSPEPFNVPDGRMAAIITIRYEYTVDLDDSGMRVAL